jgi:hypothetical protein
MTKHSRSRIVTMALTVTIATFCATTLQAAEKNEIANGDFSQVDATGKATGW